MATAAKLTIGRLARAAGVGVETVRFYERRGLIQRPLRPLDGGYRVYPETTIARIRFIREAQTLGFTLAEIRELLSLEADPSAECGAVRARAEAKLAEVEDKMRRLGAIRDGLRALIAACPGEGRARGRCSIIGAFADGGPRKASRRKTG